MRIVAAEVGARGRIVERLRGAGGFVSGARLSEELGMSRPAVWKHVQALRAEGYGIEARPRVGYRLLSSPDLLTPKEIALRLRTEVIGASIVHFDSVGSTNDEVKRLAEQGAAEGTVVVAERQQAGRGRFGRSWISPKGGIYFSFLLRPRLAPAQLTRITLVAAVAIADAISRQTGLDVRIKWPNDILAGGRKLVGILTEMSAEADSIRFVVVGVGINANVEKERYPARARDATATLLSELGRPVDRAALLAAILQDLDSGYRSLLEHRFDRILNRWRSLSATLGTRVRIATMTGVFEGTAIDVDDDGALIVRGDDGSSHVFHSGEVQHLRSR